MKKITTIAASLVILLNLSTSFANITKEDHLVLGALMQNASEALNHGDFDKLQSYFDEDFTIITVDNNKYSSIADFKNQWTRLFTGDKAKFSKLTFEPRISEEAHFINDFVGVVDGIADETLDCLRSGHCEARSKANHD